MKILANLLIFIALTCVVIGVIAKFCGLIILFPGMRPVSFIVFANTFLLLALVLKLGNE